MWPGPCSGSIAIGRYFANPTLLDDSAAFMAWLLLVWAYTFSWIAIGWFRHGAPVHVRRPSGPRSYVADMHRDRYGFRAFAVPRGARSPAADRDVWRASRSREIRDEHGMR